MASAVLLQRRGETRPRPAIQVTEIPGTNDVLLCVEASGVGNLLSEARAYQELHTAPVTTARSTVLQVDVQTDWISCTVATAGEQSRRFQHLQLRRRHCSHSGFQTEPCQPCYLDYPRLTQKVWHLGCHLSRLSPTLCSPCFYPSTDCRQCATLTARAKHSLMKNNEASTAKYHANRRSGSSCAQSSITSTGPTCGRI